MSRLRDSLHKLREHLDKIQRKGDSSGARDGDVTKQLGKDKAKPVTAHAHAHRVASAPRGGRNGAMSGYEFARDEGAALRVDSGSHGATHDSGNSSDRQSLSALHRLRRQSWMNEAHSARSSPDQSTSHDLSKVKRRNSAASALSAETKNKYRRSLPKVPGAEGGMDELKKRLSLIALNKVGTSPASRDGAYPQNGLKDRNGPPPLSTSPPPPVPQHGKLPAAHYSSREEEDSTSDYMDQSATSDINIQSIEDSALCSDTEDMSHDHSWQQPAPLANDRGRQKIPQDSRSNGVDINHNHSVKEDQGPIQILSQDDLKGLIKDLRNASHQRVDGATEQSSGSSSRDSRSGHVSSRRSRRSDSSTSSPSCGGAEKTNSFSPVVLHNSHNVTRSYDPHVTRGVEMAVPHPPLHRIVKSCEMHSFTLTRHTYLTVADRTFGIELFESAFTDLDAAAANDRRVVFRSPGGRHPVLGHKKGGAFMPVSGLRAEGGPLMALVAVDGLREGGVAHRQGSLKIGDYIIEVNGVYVGSMGVDSVRRLIESTGGDNLQLAIARLRPPSSESKVIGDAELWQRDFQKLQLKYSSLKQDAENLMDTIAELKLELRDKLQAIEQLSSALKAREDDVSQLRAHCQIREDKLCEWKLEANQRNSELSRLRFEAQQKDERVAQLRQLLIQQTELMQRRETGGGGGNSEEYHDYDYEGSHVSAV